MRTVSVDEANFVCERRFIKMQNGQAEMTDRLFCMPLAASDGPKCPACYVIFTPRKFGLNVCLGYVIVTCVL